MEYEITSKIDALDNDFTERLNANLDKVREIAIDINHIHNINNTISHSLDDQDNNLDYRYSHYHNNSPLTLSHDNSDQEDLDGDFESDSKEENCNKMVGLNHRKKRLSKFRNLTHKEVEQSLDKYYEQGSNTGSNTSQNTSTLTVYSSELDIMTTYMKGQKNLYLQSMLISRFKLNALTISSLLISASIAIFAPFIQEYYWSGGLITGLNAIIILLISMVSYLKLETAVETFHHTTKQYDKMETSLEFVASKMMFVQDTDEKSRIVLEKIQEMERNISSIKEWNQLFIPEEVRRRFPVICNINIFSFIQRIEMQKQTLIAKFKDVKNEIRYIMHVFSKMESEHGKKELGDHYDRPRLEKRLEFLLEVKDKIKGELFNCRNAYGNIDEVFTHEIKGLREP